MIIVKNLSKTYYHKAREVHALKAVSLSINANEIFGVMGKSGSGKSTLLRCMNRLEAPTKGQVFFDATELTALNAKRLREQRRHIGMIFQSFNLLNSRTVYQNVALPLELIHMKPSLIHEKVIRMLKLVGLLDHQEHKPLQLSGGQKQRVAIARALVNDPKCLLCDEPTSALDPESTLNVLALLKHIKEKLKITIVLITHEMNVIKNTCDRVAILSEGHLIEEGNVVDLFVNPKSDITKQFTQHALHLELPSYLKETLQSTPAPNLNPVVQLAFLGETANEPVIANLLKQFNVTVNILQADLESIHNASIGFLVCELTGDENSIQQAIQYLKTSGVRLEVIGYV